MTSKAAGHGTGHFIAERLSAVVLLVLMPWFIVSAALSLDGTYDSARAWLSSPYTCIGVGVFLVISLYHMRLGVQVIAEDYLDNAGTRRLVLGVNTLITLLAAAVGVYALYQISFGV
ncbi:MAG: succinate dehydrogenase, hydrophobic membrane anchor protein [Alphaproteobacteria bacterium]|nr:succinate dehydrogenase, hydrophobic membrane anchor protein [Alphaproteobacteria bacterium]